MKIFTITALLLVASVFTAMSQTTHWKADRVHSSVGFTVTHLLISEVNGEFKDFDVDVSMSGDDFKTATVNAVIKTASVNTGAEGRDKDLRSNSFFSADSFPNMTFKSDRIEQTGKDEYKIYGMLTIRSTTRPIVLNAVDKGKQDAFGTTKMGVKATTTINRFDYDVKWNKTMEAGGLIVSNSVDITLRMELNKQKMDEGAKK